MCSIHTPTSNKYGSIAQLVEWWSPKPQVIGSIPIAPANFIIDIYYQRLFMISKLIRRIIRESYNPEFEFEGYRNVKSNPIGTYGTFYFVNKPKYIESKKVKLIFENPLILDNDKVYPYEGLPLEYLFWKWFPDFDLERLSRKRGIESGELIDEMVTSEAIKKGYDGIIMGDLEIVDLKTHPEFVNN